MRRFTAVGKPNQLGGLPGCQNRVSLLVAQANLEIARSRVSRGADPSEPLEVVRRLCAGIPANVEGNAPWESVRAELSRAETW